MREILEACRRVDRGRRPAVLATVVKVAGSTYRKPGARMLFPAGGEPVGMVSGGCLEADLSERARAVLDSGEPRTVVYDMRSPDDLVWGLGLGCNGEVRVLLEPLLPGKHPGYLDFLQRCLRERRAGVVATVFAVEGETRAAVGDRITVDAGADARLIADDGPIGERLMADAKRSLGDRRSAAKNYELPAGRVEALLEYVAPPVSLAVFGAGSDAQPLVRFAADSAGRLPWRTTGRPTRARNGFPTPNR